MFLQNILNKIHAEAVKTVITVSFFPYLGTSCCSLIKSAGKTFLDGTVWKRYPKNEIKLRGKEQARHDTKMFWFFKIFFPLFVSYRMKSIYFPFHFFYGTFIRFQNTMCAIHEGRSRIAYCTLICAKPISYLYHALFSSNKFGKNVFSLSLVFYLKGSM